MIDRRWRYVAALAVLSALALVAVFRVRSRAPRVAPLPRGTREGAPAPDSRVLAASAAQRGERRVSGQGLRIRVEDDSGEGLTGASVDVSLPELDLAGRTGLDGACQLVVPTGSEQAELVVRRVGFEPASRLLTADVMAAGDVLVQLERAAGAIQGRVVWEGGPAAQGAHVLAWPSGHYPSAAALAELGEPTRSRVPEELLCARTDASGRFSLEGLARHQSYTLSAAANAGILPSPPRFGVRSGDRLEDLVLRELYGVALVITGADGGPPPVSDALAAPLLPPGELLDAPTGVEPARLVPELVLAGSEYLTTEWLRAPEGARHQDPLRITSLWYGPPSLGKLGRYAYRISLPGHREIAGSVRVPSLRAGLHVEILQAEVACDGFGQLDLVVQRVVPPGYRPAASPLGKLHLFPLQGDRELLFTVDRRPYETHRIRGIPFGRYLATFSGLDATLVWPETGHTPLEIGRSPAKLTIDLGGTCTREVVVEHVDGREYTGRLTLRLDKVLEGTSGSTVTYVVRQRGPYFLDGLVPGARYAVRPRFVPGVDVDDVEPVHFRPLASSDPPTRLVLE